MFYPFDQRDRAALPHDPFKAIIAPRPVGWISSVSHHGALNLAPYSFFNALSNTPPILAFASDSKKDSVAFIEETREFTWSMASYDLDTRVHMEHGELRSSVRDECHRRFAPARDE